MPKVKTTTINPRKGNSTYNNISWVDNTITDATSRKRNVGPSSGPIPYCEVPDTSKRGLGPEEDSHIPRPMNCFMLFRQHIIKLRKPGQEEDGSATASHMSRVIGSLWSALSEEEKKVWREKAEVAKAEHRKLYPNYKFAPKRSQRRNVKRKNKQKPGNEEEVENHQEVDSVDGGQIHLAEKAESHTRKKATQKPSGKGKGKSKPLSGVARYSPQVPMVPTIPAIPVIPTTRSVIPPAPTLARNGRDGQSYFPAMKNGEFSNNIPPYPAYHSQPPLRNGAWGITPSARDNQLTTGDHQGGIQGTLVGNPAQVFGQRNQPPVNNEVGMMGAYSGPSEFTSERNLSSSEPDPFSTFPTFLSPELFLNPGVLSSLSNEVMFPPDSFTFCPSQPGPSNAGQSQGPSSEYVVYPR